MANSAFLIPDEHSGYQVALCLTTRMKTVQRPHLNAFEEFPLLTL